MALIQFVGQGAQDADNISANTARLLNYYRQPIAQGGITQHVLKSVLGQTAYADLDTVLIRAMSRVDDVIYAVAGGGLYSVDEAAGIINLGSISDDESTTIAGSYGDVVVAADGKYYVYRSPTITQPSGKAFDSVGSVCFVGGYAVLTEKNGKKFQWTALGDAATLDPLDFDTADSRDDNILRGVPLNGRLILFKQRSMEIWYTTGRANSDEFDRVVGGTIDTGLKAFGLVTDFSGGLFFVGDDNIPYLTAGGQPEPLANPAVQTAIKQGNPTHCYTYEDEGHKFLCIRFSDRPAWCYDITTGEWHERAEGRLFGPWAATSTVERGGVWYAGNEHGRIVSLSRTGADEGDSLYRRAVSNEVYLGKRFRVRLLEILGRVGRSALGGSGSYLLDVGLGYVLAVSDDTLFSLGDFTGEPRNAVIGIRVSRDGGNTWSELKERSFGDQGEYETRAVWRSMGQFRRFCVELNCSEPTDMPINATVNLELV